MPGKRLLYEEIETEVREWYLDDDGLMKECIRIVKLPGKCLGINPDYTGDEVKFDEKEETTNGE